MSGLSLPFRCFATSPNYFSIWGEDVARLVHIHYLGARAYTHVWTCVYMCMYSSVSQYKGVSLFMCINVICFRLGICDSIMADGTSCMTKWIGIRLWYHSFCFGGVDCLHRRSRKWKWIGPTSHTMMSRSLVCQYQSSTPEMDVGSLRLRMSGQKWEAALESLLVTLLLFFIICGIYHVEWWQDWKAEYWSSHCQCLVLKKIHMTLSRFNQQIPHIGFWQLLEKGCVWYAQITTHLCNGGVVALKFFLTHNHRTVFWNFPRITLIYHNCMIQHLDTPQCRIQYANKANCILYSIQSLVWIDMVRFGRVPSSHKK